MATSPTRSKIRVDNYEFSCVTGKVVYATRDDALTGADLAMMQGLVERGCHLMPYVCQHGGHWHIRNQRIVMSTHKEDR